MRLKKKIITECINQQKTTKNKIVSCDELKKLGLTCEQVLDMIDNDKIKSFTTNSYGEYYYI